MLVHLFILFPCELVSTMLYSVMIDKENKLERIGIRVTSDEKKLVEEMTVKRGFRSVAEYLIKLVQKDKNRG